MKNLSIPLSLVMWSLYIGCSPIQTIERTIDNIIRIDTLRITLPQDVKYDTVYLNNGEGESTKYIVRVDTHKVYIKGKEKIIYVPVVDTITVTKTETKIEKSDDLSFREMFYWIGGFLVIILIIVLVKR